MAVMFDTFVDISPSTISQWIEVDVSADVPAGASGVMLLCVNTSTGTAYTVGVRKHGSSDDIKDDVDKATQRSFFIGLDANRHLDIYRGNTVIFFYLIGYFTDDAEFFTSAYDYTPTVLTTWQDRTLSEIGTNAVGAFWIIQGKGQAAGIMKKGSTWDNYTDPMEITGAFVGVNSSKVTEAYKGNASQKFWLVGYLKEGQGYAHLNTTGLGFAGYGTYYDFNLSSDTPDPLRTIGGIFRIDDTSSNDPSYKFALRKPGSTRDDYYGSKRQVWVACKLSPLEHVYAKDENAANDLYVAGYFYKPALDEECLVTVVAVVTAVEYYEEGLVTIIAVVEGQFTPEIGEVVIVALVTEEDHQTYYEERLVTIKAIVRGYPITSSPPMVKGLNPRPNAVGVPLQQKICFYLAGQYGDYVDINTVVVGVNANSYDKNDSEFTYSGTPELYYIEVKPPDFVHDETVSVMIDAKSMTNKTMTMYAYSFQAIWEDELTREGRGLIELYQAGDYSFDVLTIEEDWVVQGLERYTQKLELWWGRYQKLPYVENLQMRVTAGATNALGKEILDNGWLSVKVDNGSFVPLYSTTMIDLGQMFTHTKRDLFFKLDIPITAATTKYFVLELAFEPEMFFPYGRFQYGVGMYADAGNMIELVPNVFIYRAYVFSQAMWNEFTKAGFIISPFYRGEDKQW